MVKIRVNDDVIDDIDLFVFDKDGTLIDLYNYWYHMIALRAEKICDFYKLSHKEHKGNLMWEMGIDLKKKTLRPEGPVGLLPREDVQKAAEEYLLKLNYSNVSDTCFQIFKEVDELSLSSLDKFVKPLKGAVELLREIKKRSGKVTIATTDRTERARLALKVLNIEDLVDLVVGRDLVKCSKPAPDMLKLIGESLGVNPVHSAMVGDAKSDIQMGINADFKASIAVCNGLTSRGVLSELTPYAVDDISKIKVE